MSKVEGSYASVVLGVSEQVAQDRRSGQHEEQVNMISDPVRGLARRWGTTFDAQTWRSTGTASQMAAEYARMREYSFFINGVEYTLIYRPFASSSSAEHAFLCYCKDTKTFIPVSIQAGSALLNAIVTGGVSAVVNVGRYLYIAGNTVTPSMQVTDQYGNQANKQRLVCWVKSGAYSRTFSITLYRADGSSVSASYKTKPSAYPTALDTSDIKYYKADGTTPDPEYQKKINDRVNAYTSAVTAYIGEAAADITPENIAEKLRAALAAQNVNCGTRGGTVVMDDSQYIELTVDDGGDGSLMIGVGNEVNSPDKLSVIHRVGKVVRVRPMGASSKTSYYLQAYAKSNAGDSWQEVIWRESAGVQFMPTSMFAFAIIHNSTLYMVDNPANFPAGTGTHPGFTPNVVGDGASNPAPNFFGSKITMMSVFQDRLLIGSDGTVSLSRPGDYLNFFRQTVLSVKDDDPVEMYSYGAEGDVLRSSVMFDRDLVIFGDKKQYSISGRAVLTPSLPNISVLSSHEDSTQAYPVGSGNFVFYGKQREGRTSVHQLQVGQLNESPESYEVTQQLDTYLVGRPAQIIALTSPNTLVFRTESVSSDLYVYNYIDASGTGERLFDSWSRWRFNPVLGSVFAVSAHKGELLIFTLRQGNSGLCVVADRQNLSTELAPRPYMDSMVQYTNLSGHWHIDVDASLLDVAIGKGHTAFLFGDHLSNVSTLTAQIPDSAPYLWVGATPDSYVTCTNPFLRDKNDKAVTSGRLTITKVVPSFADTPTVRCIVATRTAVTQEDKDFSRILGDSDNLIGVQPLPTTTWGITVGREAREYSLTLKAHQWMPFTITALSWTGQLFLRTRQV